MTRGCGPPRSSLPQGPACSPGAGRPCNRRPRPAAPPGLRPTASGWFRRARNEGDARRPSCQARGARARLPSSRPRSSGAAACPCRP
eukprot:7822930-Lingulodinium_polyedra.AAC.1